MRIQQSMRRCFLHTMLLLNLILPIDVTFSTPTGVSTQISNSLDSVHIGSIRRLLEDRPGKKRLSVPKTTEGVTGRIY